MRDFAVPNTPIGCKKCARGVLCKECNAALGMVHECVETLKGLIAYLGAA